MTAFLTLCACVALPLIGGFIASLSEDPKNHALFERTSQWN